MKQNVRVSGITPQIPEALLIIFFKLFFSLVQRLDRFLLISKFTDSLSFPFCYCNCPMSCYCVFQFKFSIVFYFFTETFYISIRFKRAHRCHSIFIITALSLSQVIPTSVSSQCCVYLCTCELNIFLVVNVPSNFGMYAVYFNIWDWILLKTYGECWYFCFSKQFSQLRAGLRFWPFEVLWPF